VLTGRYQQRFGLEDNTKGALPLTEVTLAERLKPAGYTTGQVGKWHLDLRADAPGGGKADRSPMKEHMPHGQGFDEYWRGELGRFYASHDLKGQPFPDAPHMVDDRRFRVTVQTEAALSFLERRAGEEQPWFLYLAYFTPHVPLESPEPWFSKVPAHLPKERRQALAMIAAMDEGIGSVCAKLKAMGQEENTLIFFIADNGAPTKEGHWDGSINKPLIGEKGMLTEGGVRVPFLVSWPGTLPAGKVYDKPVLNLDVAATANALASLPADPKLDGVNLMPYLTGSNTAAPHDYIYWRWRSQAAVLEYPWKLIRLGPQEQFLFDVSQPEGEKTNLIQQHPDRAQQLNAKLSAWTQELSPPGLPEKAVDQDQIFFADHVDPRLAPASKRVSKEAPGSVLGWLCRNGTLSRKDGALCITPEAGAKASPFLSLSPMDFLGPATLTVKVKKGTAAAKSSITWRIRHEKDFDPAKRTPLTHTGDQLTARIGAQSRIIHLRLYVEGVEEIDSISLSRVGQEPQVWDF
jgi:arylsulfatase A-like enzyme